MTNQVFQIGYTVDGQRRYERISSPDMESAERSWKHYRAHIPYTQFTIWNPDHYGPAKKGDILS